MFKYFRSLSLRHKLLYIIMFVSVLVEWFVFNPFTNNLVVSIVANWLVQVGK